MLALVFLNPKSLCSLLNIWNAVCVIITGVYFLTVKHLWTMNEPRWFVTYITKVFTPFVTVFVTYYPRCIVLQRFLSIGIREKEPRVLIPSLYFYDQKTLTQKIP